MDDAEPFGQRGQRCKIGQPKDRVAGGFGMDQHRLGPDRCLNSNRIGQIDRGNRYTQIWQNAGGQFIDAGIADFGYDQMIATFSRVRNTAATTPVAVASASSAPSSPARRSSKARTVCLVQRAQRKGCSVRSAPSAENPADPGTKILLTEATSVGAIPRSPDRAAARHPGLGCRGHFACGPRCPVPFGHADPPFCRRLHASLARKTKGPGVSTRAFLIVGRRIS